MPLPGVDADDRARRFDPHLLRRQQDAALFVAQRLAEEGAALVALPHRLGRAKPKALDQAPAVESPLLRQRDGEEAPAADLHHALSLQRLHQLRLVDLLEIGVEVLRPKPALPVVVVPPKVNPVVLDHRYGKGVAGGDVHHAVALKERDPPRHKHDGRPIAGVRLQVL
ncbi:unnamed protein product [Phytomonas sp. EM1]|nr:unnamed protein product [Phytomonas sp. EM1]|eukprot:CCW63978.1 unnamed protein product [Phytomonas sp. isolate EM1]